jgi:hypothetical protein
MNDPDPNPSADTPSTPSDNPYAATSVDGPPSVLDASSVSAEAIRREHLSHEASLKSVGFLYCLGSLLVFSFAVVGLVASLAFGNATAMSDVLAMALLSAIGAFQLLVGVGLRGLKPWCRIPAIVLAALGLCAVPIGTLINGYILYLVASQKGATIMTEEYRHIIEQTPHIVFRTSLTNWILLILFLLVGIGIIGLLLTV